MGIPVVTFRGERAHSRISSALLETLGMEELIAETWDEYVGIVLKLLSDPKFFNRVTEKLNLLSIEDKLLETQNPAGLTKAIRYLMENHEKHQSEPKTAPILIP